MRAEGGRRKAEGGGRKAEGGRRKAEGGPRRRRVPLAGWIVLAVVAIHVLLFWAVSDKHFLPRTRYVPPAPTPNFGAGERRSVDPQTGEATTERQFQVSTQLARPRPRPSPAASPK